MSQSEEASSLEPILAAAENVLAKTFGGNVRLGEAVRQGGTKARSRVLRCAIAEAPANAPASVIVKCVTGEQETVYDPNDANPGSPVDRLRREWAGAEFLNSLATDPPLSPRFYGGDATVGCVVLEDLGEGKCLADWLQSADTEAAESFLTRYAASIGRLHATTIGKEADFLKRLDSLGASASATPSRLGDFTTEDLPNFEKACAALAIEPETGFAEEVAALAAMIEEPGPFLAFTPGDTCPDNHRAAGDYLRFFDFEFCEFRHALLDGAYLRVPFPTCWCVNRLPDDLVERMEAIYRTELAKGCPEAGDDAVFYPTMTAMCAYWTIRTVGWNLVPALEKDEQWGISSLRPRHLLRLDSMVAAAERLGRLKAIGETARRMAAKLRTFWPPEIEMPLYPPFRGGNPSSV